LDFRDARAVWRIQGNPIDLSRALVDCGLPANALVLPAETWTGMVLDNAYVECPTYFMPDRSGFLALLAYLVTRSLRFRLLVRSGRGEEQGLLRAFPRLDPETIRVLSTFDPTAADEVDHLTAALEALFAAPTALPE
jgi:hypothetical protein